LVGVEVDGMPVSQAFGLFIHDHFQEKRGDQANEGSLRSYLNNVIDVLRLDPPGRLVSETPRNFNPPSSVVSRTGSSRSCGSTAASSAAATRAASVPSSPVPFVR